MALRNFLRSALMALAVMSALSVSGPALAQSGSPSAAELAFWQSAERQNTHNSYQAYIQRYPQGHFIDLARSALAGLGRPPSPPATVSSPSTAPAAAPSAPSPVAPAPPAATAPQGTPPRRLTGNWITFADGVESIAFVTRTEQKESEDICSSGVSKSTLFSHALSIPNASAAFLNIERIDSSTGVNCIFRDRPASAEIRYWRTFANRETNRLFNGSITADGVARAYYGFSVVNPKNECVTMNGLLENASGSEGRSRFVGYFCYPEGKMNRAEVERIIGALRFKRPI